MKLFKYLVVLIIFVVCSYAAGWYYAMHKVLSQVNEKYAGQKISAHDALGSEYFVSFDKAVPSGFPFKLSAKINGWKEESAVAEMNYINPIFVGYDLLEEKIFIQFDGEIKAAFKPVNHNFGSILNIKNYYVNVDLPLNKALISTIKKMEDPFELINHIGMIKIGTGRVEIIDLNDKAKFYDKEHEQLNFNFVPAKWYSSIEDFKQNIPQKYTADYVVKTNKVDEPSRRLPVSLFYGFYTFPSEVSAKGDLTLETDAKNFNDLSKDLELHLNFIVSSPLIDIGVYKLDYTADIDAGAPSFAITNDMKFRVKAGAFDELFKYYGVLRPIILSKPLIGKFIDSEVEYIIKSKEVFRFGELENVDYAMNLKAEGNHTSSHTYIKFDNFSLFTDKSGVKFTNQSELKRTSPKKWHSKGVLYLQNYPSVVEFTSAYIYRFGKFRMLNDDARKIYVNVNKDFLKGISDHPKSESNDLSFEYEVDSDKLDQTKIGSVRFEQLDDIYQANLLNKLINHVGVSQGMIGKMKEIIPDLNENSPVVKKVLPKLEKLHEQNKTLPNGSKEPMLEGIDGVIKEAIPENLHKKIDEELWQNLTGDSEDLPKKDDKHSNKNAQINLNLTEGIFPTKTRKNTYGISSPISALKENHNKDLYDYGRLGIGIEAGNISDSKNVTKWSKKICNRGNPSDVEDCKEFWSNM